MTNALHAHGTLLQIGDGQPTETFTTIAEVESISGPNFSLNVSEVPRQDSDWMEVVPGLLDAGEISLDIHFVPTNATHGYSAGLLKDMTDRTLRNFKLVFPDSGATTWAFAAYVTGFEISAPGDDKLGASVTLRISGQPTLA